MMPCYSSRHFKISAKQHLCRLRSSCVHTALYHLSLRERARVASFVSFIVQGKELELIAHQKKRKEHGLCLQARHLPQHIAAPAGKAQGSGELRQELAAEQGESLGKVNHRAHCFCAVSEAEQCCQQLPPDDCFRRCHTAVPFPPGKLPGK